MMKKILKVLLVISISMSQAKFEHSYFEYVCINDVWMQAMQKKIN